MSNFKPVTNFWFWCQKVLPLVYDDSISYYEVLCKMSEYLNQVIDNVNALPDIIDEAVKEYIESGEIQKVLNEMLQNFNPINVKNPPAELTPARGDGETDDTAALQAMIEYGAENNLPMIFPAGVYRVTSLNIPESAYLWGIGNPTIFKAPNSENALITVTGGFTAFNMDFNGNIAGNIVPANIITGTAENISLSQCNFTGCVSCVDASVSGILDVTKCHFSNYTNYAIHADGTGRLMIDGMEVDNVANSGAMEFVRIDTSNSIVKNLTSLANVPVGVEITGDFNSVEVRIPNCKNPVSDAGQNNSYTAIGQIEKRSLQNLTENVAENSEENVGNTKTIKATDVILHPENPLTYKTPTESEGDFNYILFKDKNGDEYAIPTNIANKIKNMGYKTFKTIFDFGAVGDGVTNDTQAFISALQSNNVVFIPSGSYYCDAIDATDYNNYDTAFISGGDITFTHKQPLETLTEYGTLTRTNVPDSHGYKNYIAGLYEMTGGTRGTVQSTLAVNSVVRENTNNFIWGILSMLTVDNGVVSDSEHVGIYSQIGSENSDNGMWSGCFEVRDWNPAGNPQAGKIGVEITYNAAESDNNNMRVALQIAENVKQGATGAQMFAGIMIGGTFGRGGTETSMKYGIVLNSNYFDRILGADVTKGGQVKTSIGIDFKDIECENAAINLDGKVIDFGNNNRGQATSDGNMNLISDNGKINLTAKSVDVAGNVFSKGSGSGAPTGSATGYIPITIDGTQFKIPLYPAD